MADGATLLAGDGEVVAAVTEPQRDLFGPGAAGALAAFRGVHPWILIGARLRAGLLQNGPPPADPHRVDPRLGGFTTLGLALRVRPLADSTDLRFSPGLYLEASAGAALTGELFRPAVEAGLGFGFDLGPLTLGPTVRYVQIIEPADAVDDRDARLVLAGLEITLFDPSPPAPATPRRRPPPPAARDRDGDGILDDDDLCPDAPEDRDGFEDEDGCPETDNDGDGIVDGEDGCPMEPEDVDGFEDENGCPDLDNDLDGLLDRDDRCPDAAEIVNGVDDEDGCPDEGLIQFIHDRVVIDERVLFETNRSRVRHRAGPVLAAIAELWRQHPEWDGMRVEGHADARGPEAFNVALSLRRAERVRDALVALGMAGDKITADGFGAARPVAQGRSEQAHERNRRVEFVALRRRPAASSGDGPTGGTERP
jgi:outer membrane protein OmpA-like peptidoglycan-associated protein